MTPASKGKLTEVVDLLSENEIYAKNRLSAQNINEALRIQQLLKRNSTEEKVKVNDLGVLKLTQPNFRTDGSLIQSTQSKAQRDRSNRDVFSAMDPSFDDCKLTSLTVPSPDVRSQG